MTQDFQLVAGHLALDFANTLDYRYDPDRLIELFPTYERFLAFCKQTGILSMPQVRKLLVNTSVSDGQHTLRQVIKFREAFYSLILSTVNGENPTETHLTTFNSFLTSTRVPNRITWHKREFVLSYHDLTEKPAAPLWPIIDAAAVLLTSTDLHIIRECGEKHCRWLFLDRSRNHSRRWCDMRLCGNRSKAQRFYARTHS